VSYSYDGDGDRTWRGANGQATLYMLDKQAPLTVVLNEQNLSNYVRYVHGLTGLLAQQNPAGVFQWTLQDGLQSLRGMSDGNDMLSAQAYSPYGEPMFTDMPTEFGFTGEQTDPLNDLVYLRARYLNPKLGIFGSRDPFEGIGNRILSLNRYSWVEGNGINLIDPMGLAPLCSPNSNSPLSPVSQAGSEPSLNDILDMISDLKNTFCRTTYSICKIVNDNINNNVDIFDYREGLSSECFKHLKGICDFLCGGLTIQDELKVNHYSQGLFSRFEEAARNDQRLLEKGFQGHSNIYEDIQQKLTEYLNLWRTSSCKSSDDIDAVLETARVWQEKALQPSVNRLITQEPILEPSPGFGLQPSLEPVPPFDLPPIFSPAWWAFTLGGASAIIGVGLTLGSFGSPVAD